MPIATRNIGANRGAAAGDTAMNAPMHAAGTAFSSREYLRLLETMGPTGNWGWAFATDMQVWSPGLYRLLGLDRPWSSRATG